jgi:hypothetical protein
MNNDQTKGRTPYECMIVEAFHHNFTGLSIYSAEQFPVELRDIFLFLVEEYRSISDLESHCFGGIIEEWEFNRFHDQVKSRPHHRAFVAGIKSLLGDKDHYHKAIRYIIDNFDRYTQMSKGFFDEVSKSIDQLPDAASICRLPNYCRNEDGSLIGKKTLSKLIPSNSDNDVLLLSAIVNLDSEAVRLLADVFSSDRVFAVLRRQMIGSPGIGLEQAFGHFFKERNHVVFLAEMKQLMESSKSSKADFERAFWAGASSQVIDELVSKAVKLDLDRKPQMELMLQVFRANQVDFYPGVLLSEKGQGFYFDAFNDMPDLATRQEFIMDVIVKRAKSRKLASDQDLSVLLLDIPLEKLQSHKYSDELLKYLYMGTKDRDVLKVIQDKKFRGDMLGDQIGL